MVNQIFPAKSPGLDPPWVSLVSHLSLVHFCNSRHPELSLGLSKCFELFDEYERPH